MTRGIKSISIFSILLSLSATSCRSGGGSTEPQSTSTSGLATVVCDANFETILDQEVDVFEYIYPKANIIPIYTDEKGAIDSLLDFATKNIIISRPLTEEETSFLKSNRKQVRQKMIAVDALALIVNPSNPVNVLSKPEIAEILTGKVTRWDQVEVGGKGDISVVFDHAGSSTVKYMRDSILGGGEFGANVYAQGSPDAVFKAVADNPGAVGIIGVSWISDDLRTREYSREQRAIESQSSDPTELNFSEKVKVVAVRGNNEVTAYKPYQAYIFDGSYPLFRQIYMITTAPGGSIGHGFYSFVTGSQGQKIIQMTGILPAVFVPRMVNVDRAGEK